MLILCLVESVQKVSHAKSGAWRALFPHPQILTVSVGNHQRWQSEGLAEVKMLIKLEYIYIARADLK